MSKVVRRKKGYGAEADLPSEIIEGQELFATDTVKHTIDIDDERIRFNPPKDFNKIKNRPDVDTILNSIATFKRLNNDVKIYGVHWDKTSSSMTRLYDAAGITTDTSNFVYLGSVNENYDNPFDDIYPWSECRQCNVDLAAYRGLGSGDDLLDCVVAWYGDPDFALDGSNGFVGRYTPEFWHYGYEDGLGKVILVTDKEIEGFIHHRASIRSHGFAVDDGNDGVTSNDGQPLTNVAVSSIHAKAKAGGMTLEDIYELDANVALYMVEFADTNSQAKLGNGCSGHISEPDFTVLEAVTGATKVKLPVSMKGACQIPGSTLDFGNSKGGVVLANRRTVVSVADVDSTYCEVTFTPALNLTTSMYPSIHGKDNSDSIGNKSGYIGINGRNNAWYRGMILYSNRYRYVLGAYRQTGTNHFWLCDPETCDDYDALNTSVHIDTGITQYTPASASWQQVADYGVPEGKLSSIGMITKAGSIVGDQQYCPLSATGNTVALAGGPTGSGASCGVLCFYWNTTASGSSWNGAGALLLKIPM